MAAKKKTSKGNKITKSGFIRGLPDRTPAKEVIAKAKEAGLELTEKFVWTIQSEMRSKAEGRRKKSAKQLRLTTSAPAVASASSGAPNAPAKSKGRRKGKSKKGSKKTQAKVDFKATAGTDSSSAEQKMKVLIVQLGTTRAEQVYRTVKSQLDALVGGA